MGAHGVGGHTSPLFSGKAPLPFTTGKPASEADARPHASKHLRLAAAAPPEGTQTPASTPQSVGCAMYSWELGNCAFVFPFFPMWAMCHFPKGKIATLVQIENELMSKILFN